MATSSDPVIGWTADEILDMDDVQLDDASDEAGLAIGEFLSLFDFVWGSPTEQVEPGPWL